MQLATSITASANQLPHIATTATVAQKRLAAGLGDKMAPPAKKQVTAYFFSTVKVICFSSDSREENELFMIRSVVYREGFDPQTFTVIK